MKRSIRQCEIAIAMLCCSALNAIAGESVKYTFDGWTVTVTPRQSARPKTQGAKVSDARKESTGEVNTKPITSHGVKVRPIALQQTIVPPQPSPAAQETVSPRNSLVPLPETGFVPPGSPMAFSSTQYGPIPPAPSCPDCEPIINPRAPEIPRKPQAFVPQTALYKDIYFSIPFNRVEYNAYPSYRHDATMELLFNQMRPTIIQRGAMTVNDYAWNYGYGGGYGFGGNGFGSIAGYPYTYPYAPYYPFSYGLRIHRNP